MTENQAMTEEAFTARLNELIPDGQEVYSLEVLVAHVNRRDSLISTLEANNDRLRAENERLRFNRKKVANLTERAWRRLNKVEPDDSSLVSELIYVTTELRED